MDLIDKMIEGRYWVVYYLIYVVGVGVGAGIYWWEVFGPDSQKVERLYIMAAIAGLAAGLALLVVIILEVTGRMVLLIPAAWRKAKQAGREEGLAEGREEGRAEGREEGRAEGREEGRAEGREEGLADASARMESIIEQYGEIDPETGAITLDREARRLLFNRSGKAG